MSSTPVVHVVQRMAPGGIETFVLDLMREMGGSVISLEGTADGLIETWPALAGHRGCVIGLGAAPGIKASLPGRIGAHLKERKAQGVMLHHVGPLLYGTLGAKLAGVGAIIHVEHDVWHYTSHPSHKWIARGASRFIRPHVVQSAQSQRVLRSILPRAEITTIPTGIDLERFRPQDKAAARASLAIPADVPLVGTVGRLVPVKAQDDLIRAFATLTGKPELVICGDGPERSRLEALVSRLRLDGRVRFLGHRDDVAAVLPAFDVFCLTSQREGLPRSILEAQACGVPVVATDAGAVAEAICPKTGIAVPAGEISAIAAALTAVLGRPAGALSPRSFVEDEYCWRRTLRAYSRLMES